jgi:glycine/serine hydroxymethyltransferase
VTPSVSLSGAAPLPEAPRAPRAAATATSGRHTPASAAAVRAVRLVDRYHRDFPRGALGPDAAVVALEAVAARRAQLAGIVSGRTESHVLLVDLRSKGITGKDAEALLQQTHMTCNKNSIPNDPQRPLVMSGIRLGSPAMTTRGFTEEQSRATGRS